MYARRSFVVIVSLAGLAFAADPAKRFVYPSDEGRLVYDRDERGNRIPDFSHCGYLGGGARLPDAAVRVVVSPGEDDATQRIQAAIDHVSKLPADRQRLRGAVLLLAGKHRIGGQLRITQSGVVLRGQGQDTVLVATGTDRRPLIRVAGKLDQTVSEQSTNVGDAYVPVGASVLHLEDAAGLSIGDAIQVRHPSTPQWVAALGMNRFPSRDVGSWLDWRPGSLDLHWDRTITKIDGHTVTLDAPLTAALDRSLGQSTVAAYAWPGRLQHVGIENMRCESEHDAVNPKDEEHSWTAVSIEAVQDGWVRQISAQGFAHTAVCIRESCSRITVEDCQARDPVSEMAAYRRHSFFTAGEQTLFQRCRSSGGRHDFSVGSLAAGPNAFVHCQADAASHFSGPIESWATGVLYDNIKMDGGGLALTNRETDGQGVGWAAANCVLWQCTAPLVTCRRPPTGQNWAIGCWGQFVGDGHWRSLNEFVEPDSLYYAQLQERRSAQAVAAIQQHTIPADPRDAPHIDQLSPPISAASAPPRQRLTLDHGWLLCDGKLLAGGRTGTVWWRGSILPSRAGELGLGITRFVPGRDGPGYTDDLEQVARSMQAKGQVALEHHWGLWYDRRRDDHQMIRRMDGEVWPPFYEQPWARSGQGLAWDGLSKYDLTRYNPWYFDRLRAFADLCDRDGLLLMQQMYFQHNVLEAGAHWADFPWRSANCLQDTGFPEPPPYENNKRVFMAEAFYDLRHPVRLDLHRAYIRHCLGSLGSNTNVLFFLGEEFTGPAAFVEFWLDTIDAWQQETGRHVLVGLSCTKDVQDRILADSRRAALVGVIDIKYWWPTADRLYDPPGGRSLAPRQQLREWRANKSRSDVLLARHVREFRRRFPEKAVLCSIRPVNPWLTLCAGASLAPLPATTDPALLAGIPSMRPFEADTLSTGQWALSTKEQNYLVYSAAADPIRLKLPAESGTLRACWIDTKTGRSTPALMPSPHNGVWEFGRASAGDGVLWLTR